MTTELDRHLRDAVPYTGAMSYGHMKQLERLQAKWDAKAAPQLRAEIEILSAQVDEFKARAEKAESEAVYLSDLVDSYMEEQLAMYERNGLQPGITKDGRLVAVRAQVAPPHHQEEKA